MSRYPGTQFKVYDNSQTTAIVPVTPTNESDAVKYLTSFASVKGPEKITLTHGSDFYTIYGTQDKIDYKKYGQPLFQASMNINNGAALYAKRAVLDDATLANATLAVVLTKYKDAKVNCHTIENGDGTTSYVKDLIGEISYNNNAKSKYSLAPLVFSIDNVNNYANANTVVDEYKEIYDLYKDYIEEVIANDNTPNQIFLNKLFKDQDNKILSGFTQSIYYNSNGEIVNITTDGKESVRSISSITTGLYSTKQKTYSSNFAVSDIIDYDSYTIANSIKSTDKFMLNNAEPVVLDIYKAYLKEDAENGNSIEWKSVKTDTTVVTTSGTISYYDIYNHISSISRVISCEKDASSDDIQALLKENISDQHSEWLDEDYALDDSNEYAVVISEINTDGYTYVSRLLNDIMVENSGYIECEYVFPMFTIFDNGRGESAKSIGIEYDSASSTTLKKAIYTLTVYNYDTSKKIESFSFSLNPYTRNNNTGYTLDIESAVNYVSNQISAKTYYNCYEALLETLKAILESTDDDIITNNDILFGHESNTNKYPAFYSYYISTVLKRTTSIYDYAHLDIFDNDSITINAYCDADNMTMYTNANDTLVRYYYYNYSKIKQKVYEKIEKGTDGYYLGRTVHDKKDNLVPFIVIDENDTNFGDDKSTVSMLSLIDITGNTNGTVISVSDGASLTDTPIVPSNFYECKVKLAKAYLYTYGENGKVYDATGEQVTTINTANPTGKEVYITINDKSKSRYNIGNDTTPPTGVEGDVYYYVSENAVENEKVNVYIPYVSNNLYQEQYRRFFSGEYDKDIFNLDVYFPNALFDANYFNSVKLAIQRLAAYRGDFMCYMDMGINKVKSYEDCEQIIPSTSGGLELTEDNNEYYYVRDMHIAVTCLNYKIRNPYDNKVITVTGTYGLSNLYIGHFASDASKVFAGISNGIIIDGIIEGSANYIPKIYPTSKMTSLNNIGGVYPSDDETIMNEKQKLCDLRVNYGAYYDDRFSIETEYTMNATESEFSYWNNVALVCVMMQSIRKACPSARYQFITSEDLGVYKTAVETAMKPWKNKFAKITFKYVQDDNALQNKIFYAAIEVVFKPFAQAEIFELTALNYSTLSSTVTGI